MDVRLDEVVLRALEKEPERRYQHASDVKTEVESISPAPTSATAVPPLVQGEPGKAAAATAAFTETKGDRTRGSTPRRGGSENLYRWQALALVLGLYALSSFPPAITVHGHVIEERVDGKLLATQGTPLNPITSSGSSCFSWGLDLARPAWFAQPLSVGRLLPPGNAEVVVGRTHRTHGNRPWHFRADHRSFEKRAERSAVRIPGGFLDMVRQPGVPEWEWFLRVVEVRVAGCRSRMKGLPPRGVPGSPPISRLAKHQRGPCSLASYAWPCSSPPR